MLPIPYRILAVAAVALALVWGGYRWGARAERNALAAQQLEQQRIVAARARQLAQVDTSEAVAAEQARAAFRIQSMKDRHALEQDIARVGDRGCGLDPDSFRLLNDRIRSANGSPAAGRGDGPVPPDPGASGRQRADTAPVDG